MKRDHDHIDYFVYDESFEDLIKMISEDNYFNQSSSYEETNIQPKYFSLELQKKAEEWDIFMMKSENFKPSKNKFKKKKTFNKTIQGSITKWSRCIKEMEESTSCPDVFLQNKNCSKERRQLLESLPKVDEKMSILEKQVENACKIKDKESKNVRSKFLKGILKKEDDKKKMIPLSEHDLNVLIPETDFYFSFDYHCYDEIFTI